MSDNRNVLEEKARRIRVNTLRQIHCAGSGHQGGALSCADILCYVYSIKTPDDFFILSKGHAAPALYAVFAEYGLLDESALSTFRQANSKLQGHPTTELPGIVTPTGSLGQGTSVGVGIAMGLKYAKKPGRVVCLLGDGELQEGIVWEAAMCAAHYHLDNLLWIVDYNGLQSDAKVWDTMRVQPLWDKFNAFSWYVKEIDGNKMDDIEMAFNIPIDTLVTHPMVILAHTTKGKGVSFMEGKASWHGSCQMTDDELKLALEELA
ncbi:transketolase [Candidatus Bathyarchaeota archaeon]|nr:transketolase [Candidatus Bathyarchaeota archaeon]